MADNDTQNGGSSADKRRATRASVRIPASFSVLMPEETFSPTLIGATILNLSESGVMVEVSLPAEIYTSMLSKVRYCRVDIDEPENIACKIIGRAVWIQPRTRDGNTICHIGLYFENAPEAVTEKFQEYVDSLYAENRRQNSR